VSIKFIAHEKETSISRLRTAVEGSSKFPRADERRFKIDEDDRGKEQDTMEGSAAVTIPVTVLVFLFWAPALCVYVEALTDKDALTTFQLGLK
jgi:hypothetical protein